MCTCNYAITYVFPYIFSSVAQRMEGCQEWWLQLKYGITPLLGVHAVCEGCFKDVLVFRDFSLSWNGWHWVCWRCAIGFHIKKKNHQNIHHWTYGQVHCHVVEEHQEFKFLDGTWKGLPAFAASMCWHINPQWRCTVAWVVQQLHEQSWSRIN